MSEIFKRFKDFSVISKLMDEMERSLEIRDKVLAEFVLALAKKSKTVMEFEEQLKANGADFSVELISNMFALITKMLPESFPRTHSFRPTIAEDDPIETADAMKAREYENGDDEMRRKELAGLFPSLAQKNEKNKEEIDLDLDDSSDPE